jgi:3-oxoacyl-[acyl-carrier-protein] synthase II
MLAGESAIRPLERFQTDRYISRNASWIENLEPETGKSRMYPLLKLLLKDLGPVPVDSALITATTKGCIDSLELLKKGLAAAPHDIAVEALLQWLGSKYAIASGININAACASSTIAIARAAALIAAGRSETALVVCMDLVSEFVFSGFSALQALSVEPCRPFDLNRSGLSLGEGGCALLLMSGARARREKRHILGSIAGWGAANDATHITAPARDGCGLIQATRQAVRKAGINLDDIAAVNAHGTGTVYNDQMELTAFRTLFGERQLPMHSVKGSIGHTLGAAGGIEVALGLKSLQSGLLPPTVGLVEPETGAEGRFSSKPQHINGSYLLTTNSGFGGVNAALILRSGGA